jgi:hypothetical protein
MTQTTADHTEEGKNDTMSKLVGALIFELADDVPDRPGLETVRADLLAASRVYEHGKKKDLTLRFYLAIRSLLHEVERLEKLEAERSAAQQSGFQQQGTQQPGSNENFQPQQQGGSYPQ